MQIPADRCVDHIKGWAALFNEEQSRIIWRIFLLSISFIAITAYVAIQSIWSITSVNDAFEHYHAREYTAMKNLNTIARDLLQIRTNMIHEEEAAARKDAAFVETLAKNSMEMEAEYKRLWQAVSASLDTPEERVLMEEWNSVVPGPASIRARFHAATRRGDVAAARVITGEWAPGYRRLRDIAYRLIEMQEESGVRIKQAMLADARKVINRSYLLMAVSLFAGFVLTFVLIRNFIASARKPVTLQTLIPREDVEKEVDYYR